MTHGEHDTKPGALPDNHVEYVEGYEEHTEIDALLDGEAVERDALRRALDADAARDYLVDALLLRQLTRDIGPSHFVAPARRRPLLHAAQWLAAGMVLVLGTSAGYVYGQRTQGAVISRGSVQVVLDERAAPDAPQPTRIIRFEPGVNWTSDAGHSARGSH
jgi:hypothetical protein